MAFCPNCKAKVPFESILWSSHLDGIVCPDCDAHLRSKYWSSLLLMALAMGGGWLAGKATARAGEDVVVQVLMWSVVFVFLYVALSPVILRLRVRDEPAAVSGGIHP